MLKGQIVMHCYGGFKFGVIEKVDGPYVTAIFMHEGSLQIKRLLKSSVRSMSLEFKPCKTEEAP